MAIFDEILLRRDGVAPNQWPKLSCSQANQLALEDSDLRLDANRKIIFYNASSSSTSLQIAGDGSIIGSLTCQSDLSVSGNLGVGTTNPTEKLDVAGKIKATDLEANGAVQADTLQIAGNGNLGGSLTCQSDLSVSGNLGVGTTNPTEKLDVAGKIKATDLEANGAVQADTLQIAGNGNLGGSLTCQSDLSVSGNLNVGGDISGRLTGIGIKVMPSISNEQTIKPPDGFSVEECVFLVALKFINIDAVIKNKDNKYCNCTVDKKGKVTVSPKNAVAATGIALAKKGGW